MLRATGRVGNPVREGYEGQQAWHVGGGLQVKIRPAVVVCSDQTELVGYVDIIPLGGIATRQCVCIKTGWCLSVATQARRVLVEEPSILSGAGSAACT